MSLFEDHLRTGQVSSNISEADPLVTLTQTLSDQRMTPQMYFLVDSFKRARTTGFPIHEFVKSYDPRPATKFTTDEYDH